MSDFWIFGGSKALGAFLAQHLSKSNRIVSFSRTAPANGNAHAQHITVDFQNVDLTRKVIQNQFALNRPAGAVFCQRFRPAAGLSELEAIQAGMAVELGPVIALADEAKKSGKNISLSMVLLTSVAGNATHSDIGLYYHVLKSVALTTSRFLAVHAGASGVRANCIILGEFEKYPRESYTSQEQDKFSLVERFTPTRRICTKEDIANSVEFLLSDKSSNISGQSIALDGHLSGLAPEAVIRQFSSI